MTSRTQILKEGDLMRYRCIWRFPNVPTKVQRKGWYSPEWTGHPAKMPSYLARTIIEIYTKPGDIILDPMSGFFTTGIEGGRLGRHCIGIEFERKYVDSVRKSIEVAQNHLALFETFTTPMIIHGDARALPLRSADVVVTSPPYSQGGQGQGKDYHPERMAGSEAGLDRGYSEDNRNIGNLPYSKSRRDSLGRFKASTLLKLDAEQMQVALGTLLGDAYLAGTSKSGTKRLQIGHGPKQQAYIEWKYRFLSSIVRTPPQQKAHGAWHFSTLKHPQLSELYRLFYPDGKKHVTIEILNRLKSLGLAVWFMDDASSDRGLAIEFAVCGFSFEEIKLIQRWFWQKWGIICKPKAKGEYYVLWFGKKDAYYLSRLIEPYILSEMRYKLCLDNLYHTRAFGENLFSSQASGNVSAVVTSPPYGDDPTGRDWSEHKEDSDWRCGHKHPAKRYSDDQANIGNLKYMDACIFSPAYGNRLSDQRVRDDDPQRMSYRQSLASPTGEQLSAEKGIPPVTYSPDKDNIGSQKGETYLQAMFCVYQEIFRVLKPGGLCILVLKNFVRDKKIVRLDLDTRTLCEAAGFTMLPCPEGCRDRGHTHLRVIGQHSFWIRNLVNSFYAMEGLVALGYEREELAKDTGRFKLLVSATFPGAKTTGMSSAVISAVRKTIPDWEPPPCPYEQASKFEQIQVYRKAS